MKKSLATLLTALILFSCGWTPACIAEPTETDAVWEQVSEAYIYAFPLVLTNATKTMSTNTDGSVTGRAPVNQINHAKKLADASFRTVVTPNVDTLYSQAWLDIGAEPMVYVLPETDRFCNVQLLDAWTNTAAVLDRAGAYAIALPSWTGELPENVTRVDVPTETVWSIARVVLSGNEDLPNVYAIQDQMRLLPLSAYLAGGDYAAPGLWETLNGMGMEDADVAAEAAADRYLFLSALADFSAPLGKFAGVGGDLVVTAFQSASGLVNILTPTAAVVMGALALGHVPYDRWVKYVWKLMLWFLLLALVFLVAGVLLG